ncbi:hypothetical protein [uncultured Cohaesibacter sp.]|uniref:AAA family ATPase n=1 Tax=uncultured Cohaesibacter sp. TaxID=1002546 RepID=UPI0029C73033|nr:hypothetical protein [uncultured Cohaesibacter sp.]
MESFSYQIPATEPFDTLEQDHQLSTGQPHLPTSVSDAQRVIVAFLSDPMSYGETEPVDRIDMMSSMLFMAGDYCYKLRRDLPLGQEASFSLEQRHQLAKKEMRLGTLFAPDLYLDLVPIRQLNGQLFIDLPRAPADVRTSDPNVEAPVVEWLIRMQRYDFSKCYDKQVEIYQPNFDECHRLADLISPSQTRRQKRQSARTWLRHLEEMIGSFSPLVRTLDREAKNTTLRACLNRASELLDRAESSLQDRCHQGQFRPIHGNLGLSNVLETHQGLRLIHPLVLWKSSQVRQWQGDPFYDLASLIAELWSRGLHRQANWVFSHYCNSQFDSSSLSGLKVLDLYIFIRAMDRSRLLKSALTGRPGDPLHDTDGGMKPRALKGYVNTARESLLQDEASLVVIGGSTHANRSNLARLLAPVTGRMPGAVYLSADQEMLALHETRSSHDLPRTAHRKSVWRLVYRRMAEKALVALETGYSVILEGRFDSPESREILTELDQKVPTSTALTAFHLFDSKRDHRHGASFAATGTMLGDLELWPSQLRTEDMAFRDSEKALPILRNVDLSRDWTRWIELDASCSVGSLLEQALARINPEWAPISEGTLH